MGRTEDTLEVSRETEGIMLFQLFWRTVGQKLCEKKKEILVNCG